MALKQDERALLQLVCERGQSYADLAELLGIPEGAVREKAQSALAELGGADPDAEVGLTDYLLGQADPIGRADAVRYLQQDEGARELAETISTKILAIAPAAQLPKLPEPKGRRRKAASPPATDRTATRKRRGAKPGEPAAASPAAEDDPAVPGRSPQQTRMIAGLAGAGVILLFVILAVAGVFGGDDGDAPQGEEAAALAQQELESVPLSAENGSGVAGTADFGIANDSNVFVDLTLSGLDPEIGRRTFYVLWLMVSDGGGFPVSVVVPGNNGNVQDRYAVPSAVAAAVLGTAQEVRISRSPAGELGTAIETASEQGVPLVPFTGTTLASGDVPLAEGGAAPPDGEAGGGDAGADSGLGELPGAGQAGGGAAGGGQGAGGGATP